MPIGANSLPLVDEPTQSDSMAIIELLNPFEAGSTECETKHETEKKKGREKQGWL